MKRHLIALWLIVGLLAWPMDSSAQTTPVGAIYGASVACDPALTGCIQIPLSASLLCDGTGAILDCPQYFAPDWAGSDQRFFGWTNRVNPGRCVQSTNGGTTWGACPTQPFVAALDVNGASLSVASDGSLIVAADQGANNCIIRRSTDYGANWSTVFTDTTAGVSCGIGFGAPTPSITRCAQTGGYCLVFGRGAGAFEQISYFSTDNGANWTKGSSATMVSGDAETPLRFDESASIGVTTVAAVTYNSTFAGVKSGNNMIVTTAIPLPPGAGASARCPAPFTWGGIRSFLCGGDSLNTGTYRLFNIIGTAPTFISSFIPTDAPLFANAPDPMAVGFNATTAYMIQRNIASTQINIYVTRDSFGSIIQIANILPTTALGVNCCRGDTHIRSGKIYFTTGHSGSNGIFGVIQ